MIKSHKNWVHQIGHPTLQKIHQRYEEKKQHSDELWYEKHLKDMREQEGITCSKCGDIEYRWDNYSKSWICKTCGHHNRLCSGTIMENSKLPLHYWFTAFRLIVADITISATDIQKNLATKDISPFGR